MSELLVDRQGSTTVFTLNRPESMNSLSRGLMASLTEGIAEFNRDPQQKVAIITAAGDKAFCAGADLKEMASGAASGGALPVSPGPDIAGIAASEKPIIAAVNGLAVAGGMELSLCCDIRIATPESWFGVFEVKRGILAGIAVNVLPRLLPYGVAADLLLAAERLPAERAYALGLVQQIVDRDSLLDAALTKADAISQSSPSAVWGSKQVLKYWRNLQQAEQQAYYQAVVHRVLLSGDVLEGPRAFAEKREARFSDGWPAVPGF
jgi:enoyl-CoA hydratase/carnithine racemase